MSQLAVILLVFAGTSVMAATIGNPSEVQSFQEDPENETYFYITALDGGVSVNKSMPRLNIYQWK